VRELDSSLINLLLKYFQLYGYYLLFSVLFLENTVLVGLIVPGETVLLAASFLVSQDNFNLITVISVAIFGALAGNNLGYLIGSRGGRPFVERFGHYFGVSPQRIKAAEEYFGRHGGKTVFIGRFAVGIRVFVSLLAGASHMNYPRFFLYTFAAVVSWTLLIATVGFVFGRNWERLVSSTSLFGWVVLLLSIVFLLVYLYLRARKKRETSAL